MTSHVGAGPGDARGARRRASELLWIAALGALLCLAAGAAVVLLRRHDPGLEATGVPTPLARRVAVGVTWLSAQLGRPGAQYALGQAYANGYAVRGDLAKAMRWYLRAAEHGHLGAQFSLAEAYCFGQPPQMQQAVRWWRVAAERGHYDSQYRLADVFARGVGVPLDPAEGVRWWRAMAEKGDLPSKHNLAWALSTGWGVPRAPEAAVAIWTPLAKGGDSVSACQLGLAYAAGAGVPRDPAKALALWREAADLGGRPPVPECSLALCRAYARGDGVERDLAKASGSCRRASGEGGRIDEAALASPSTHSYVIVRVSQARANAREARGLLESLLPALLQQARKGDPEAQWEVGRAYLSGVGLKHDRGQGMLWLRKAAAQGHEKAREAVARAEASATAARPWGTPLRRP
jgi:uncharacterized protein